MKTTEEKIKSLLARNNSFRTINDACNHLGQNYKGCQRAWVKSKLFTGYMIWFFKPGKGLRWNNTLNVNMNEIREKPLSVDPQQHYKRSTDSTPLRITFYYCKETKAYKYLGIYQCIAEESSTNEGIVIRKKL